MAKKLQNKRPDLIVEAAHMELASPTIQEGVDTCIERGATEIVAHPYMLAPGRHATQDIPKMAQKAVQSHPHVVITTSEPLGIDDALMDLILKRANLIDPGH